MSNSSTKNVVTLASQAVTLFGVALWLGGMLTLGALVAPVVFTIVPAPTSADAMTIVFRRFDVVAVTCSAAMLASEIWRVRAAEKISRIEIARGVSLAIAALLALVEALVVSPRIAELHRAGAVRGLGDLGQKLESMHALAEAISKTEALSLAIFLMLYLVIQERDRGEKAAKKAA